MNLYKKNQFNCLIFLYTVICLLYNVYSERGESRGLRGQVLRYSSFILRKKERKP